MLSQSQEILNSFFLLKSFPVSKQIFWLDVYFPITVSNYELINPQNFLKGFLEQQSLC